MSSAVGKAAAAGLFALLLAACGGQAQSAGAAAPSPYEAAASSAASVGALYRALNAAVVDAYVVGALADHGQPVGAAQPCLRTDNRLSSRRSPLAEPPFAEASIAQRARLTAALAAYELVLASFAQSEPSFATRVATGEFERATFDFGVAANAHAQGDLFVEDLSSKLTALAAPLANARDRRGARLVARDADPAVRKLIAILAGDVDRQHAAALGAATMDYERWIAYYEKARAESSAREPSTRTSFVPVRCSEPAVPQDQGSPDIADVSNDGASFAGRQTILARVEAARERYDELRGAGAAEVVSALARLNEALAGALDSPDDAAAAKDAQSALRGFSAAAQAIGGGSPSAQRPP